MKKKGITASDLKYIAILAMFIDHVAWLAIPTTSVLGQIMHFIGRTTAPIMCYFLYRRVSLYKEFQEISCANGRICVYITFCLLLLQNR